MAIDASQGPIPAKAFIAASKQATGKEFGRLINTHHHGDHVNGNQFFPHAEIWSHPYCRDEVLKAIATTPKTWTPTPRNCGRRPKSASSFRRSVTFKDDLTVLHWRHRGAVPICRHLPHLGRHDGLLAAKRRSCLPEMLRFFWVAPYANNSYISKWIDTCDKIAGWDVDVIVPGHGPIGGKKELAEMADYFRVLGVEARKRYDTKMTRRRRRRGNPPGQVRQLDRSGAPHHGRGPLVRGVGRHSDAGLQRAAVREATLEYNDIKKKAGQTTEIIPLSRVEALADPC